MTFTSSFKLKGRFNLNKYFITPLKQRISTLRVTQDEMETWIKGWKFFFILGFGRSGTAFMADFLNQAREAYVFHEPVFEDFLLMQGHITITKPQISIYRDFAKRRYMPE